MRGWKMNKRMELPKDGIWLGGVYRSADGYLWAMMVQTSDECIVAHRVGSKSQRLFYPDGQYVGAGTEKDIIAA